MQIELTTLPHQKKAIKSIIKVLNKARIIPNEKHLNANPILDKTYIRSLISNIEKVQQDNFIPPDIRKVSTPNSDSPLVLDIKMETGTGKTCVYTELMCALNKYYGFNKFLIIVPSIAIREGTRNFILSNSAKTYLRKDYENQEINLTIFERQQQKKNKRFPSAVWEYFNGTILTKNKIHALLIGPGIMTSSKQSAMNTDYEQSLLDEYTKPYEAIAYTKPIVIIDEPHRFKKENKTYQYILDNLKPQMIIRFGATFPDIKTKNGIEKDYENLIYDLNAAKAFNDTLIKGVASECVGDLKEEPIKITAISNTRNNRFIKFNQKDEKYYVNTDLSTLNKTLAGISIQDIVADTEFSQNAVVVFSNGLKLSKGDKFYPEIFGEDYQMLMIKAALKRHFDAELDNVKREDKIKTLCLFFIDDIYSYRDENNPDNKGRLRVKFEEILQEYLKTQIEIVDKEIQRGYDLQDYKAYLQASIENISETNGGYFCKDNNTSDEEIKKEVDDILRNKEKLLSFRNENGTYNLRRFLFSKWTLREGWDNPNVFTIAKLRSSGSEISKLQEVGRGLRLPVDINGNRKIEQFYLNYIVDSSEKEFAEKLVKEVNGEVMGKINIENIVKDYAQQTDKNPIFLFADMAKSEFIDRNYVLNLQKFDKFREEYPMIAKKIKSLPKFIIRLQNGKIINRNKKQDREKVRIRPERFNELKDLWEILNRKYYIVFEDLPENVIIGHIVSSISQGINDINELTTTGFKTVQNENEIALSEFEGQTFIYKKSLKYSEALKQISKYTNIPIRILHKGFMKFHEQNSNVDLRLIINENFVSKVILNCKNWIRESISKYSYERLDVKKIDTALTYNGNVKETVTKNDIGVHLLENYNTPEKFLYDLPLYDSDLEKKDLKTSSQKEIIVFGKIPRRSIKIPTYFGETYSPDFMYVIKNNNSVKKICCVVETKGVQTDGDKRTIENAKINCAKIFYKKLQEDLRDENIQFFYKEQKINDSITQIIHELLNYSNIK